MPDDASPSETSPLTGLADEAEHPQSDASAPARRQRRSLPRFGATGLLLCMAVAAVAAAMVAFGLYRPEPPSLAVAAPPSEAPLVAEEMADSRAVDLGAKLGEEAALASPVSGTVTSTTCVAGTPFASGASSIVVDRTPLVNLHTATPLWRDLAFGNEGADVAALQRELARLGSEVAETGRFDWQTWTAWDALVEKLGGDTTYGELSLAQIVWLPAAETPVAACPVRLGQAATQGEPLVSLATPLLSASVTSYPTDLVPGARKLVVDGADVAIDENGQLTADGLAALTGTETYARYAQSPEDATLQAELVLAEPVTVYPVPPAAVAMTGETTGCVTPISDKATSSTPVPVTVVSSKLGRTYVTFVEQPKSETIAATAEKSLTCS